MCALIISASYGTIFTKSIAMDEKISHCPKKQPPSVSITLQVAIRDIPQQSVILLFSLKNSLILHFSKIKDKT